MARRENSKFISKERNVCSQSMWEPMECKYESSEAIGKGTFIESNNHEAILKFEQDENEEVKVSNRSM